MRFQFTLTGVSPLIQHNGAAGLDAGSPLSVEIAEIAAKKGRDRTKVDDERLRLLECQRSLYLDDHGKPTLPRAALRTLIEAGARKLRQGGLVREGLMVESVKLQYDVKRYGGTLEELCRKTQFVVPVVVQRQRVARTRAKFDRPWSVVGIADVDPELVDAEKLTAWLQLGGRRIGLGDWRPERSGEYGRFDLESVMELPTT